MDILKQEKELLKIFNTIKKIKPDYNVPELYQIAFRDSRVYSGKVYKSRECPEASEMVLGLGANNGDFSADNEYFVDTVLHELVHWNGISGHRENFWKALQTLKEAYEDGLRQ